MSRQAAGAVRGRRGDAEIVAQGDRRTEQSVVDQSSSDATACVQDLATRLGLHAGSEATLPDPFDVAHSFGVVDRHRCTPSPWWGRTSLADTVALGKFVKPLDLDWPVLSMP